MALCLLLDAKGQKQMTVEFTQMSMKVLQLEELFDSVQIVSAPSITVVDGTIVLISVFQVKVI